MTSYQRELVEIIRRIAERGKLLALDGETDSELRHVDVYQHILDELERLK